MSKHRKPISKRLRFEVLNRDGFTCMYCGAEPPCVKLHVDHIRPVSDGGLDEIDNLVTACEDCNLGKSDEPLSSPIGEQNRRALATYLYELAIKRFGREALSADAFEILLDFCLSEPDKHELEIAVAASRDWQHAVANFYRIGGYPDYMCEPFYP